MVFIRSLLFFTAFIFALIILFTIIRRNQLSTTFALLLTSIMIYTLGYAFELGSANVEELKFWLKFEYFGLSFVSAFWFFFAYRNRFRKDPGTMLYLAVIIIPVATLFFSATNDYHNFYYKSVSAVWVDGALIAQLEKGPWYYIFIVYSNLLIGLVFLGYFVDRKKSPNALSNRSFWLLMGSVSVVVFQMIYQVGLSPYNIDLTPFGFFVAACLQLVTIFRYDLFKADELVRDVILENMSEGIIIVDTNERISDYNTMATKIFEWLVPDVIGMDLSSFKQGVLLTRTAKARSNMEIQIDGIKRFFEIRLTMIVDQTKEVGKIYMVKDVTALRKVFKRLYRLANFDTLTRVYNRRRFFQEAERAVESAVRFNERVSVLMLDLDLFKDVNDKHGHQAGDKVLKEVAGIVRDCLDNSDILGRYGGEEFAIVLADEKSLSALGIAENIRKGVEKLRVNHGSEEICVTVSIGVAQREFGNINITLESLLAEADRALYRAKKEGRNMVCFSPSRVNSQ